MLRLLTSATPLPLSRLLDDLGSPSPRTLARALGVTERTARRWIATDQAPRPVLLALHLVTRWGMSERECELHNAAAVYRGHARSLLDELAALRRELARVVAAGAFDSANAPTWRDLPMSPLEALPASARMRVVKS